jgi:hypothetical protein
MSHEPSSHRKIVDFLCGRNPLPPLTPEHVWHPKLDEEIAELSLAEVAGDRPEGLHSAIAWKAMLHLYNDSIDRAHELVQPIDTPTGSALHGIVHRREGDYENAKYWFRRTGDHPAWHGLVAKVCERMKYWSQSGDLPDQTIGQAIQTIAANGVWNPYAFVDAVSLVERRVDGNGARAILEEIQLMEMAAFLKYLESRLMLA